MLAVPMLQHLPRTPLLHCHLPTMRRCVRKPGCLIYAGTEVVSTAFVVCMQDDKAA